MKFKSRRMIQLGPGGVICSRRLHKLTRCGLYTATFAVIQLKVNSTVRVLSGLEIMGEYYTFLFIQQRVLVVCNFFFFGLSMKFSRICFCVALGMKLCCFWFLGGIQQVCLLRVQIVCSFVGQEGNCTCFTKTTIIIYLIFHIWY